MTAIIEVEKLTKSYGRRRGIADVSFQVGEGEVFGFLGPNGAGKTTTIRVLMALIRADSGSAKITGLDCWDRSVDIKRSIGYVPGEPSLDGNLTGGQILGYFANLRGGVDQKYLKQLVERLDLDTGRKFRQYSTGSKRKVVLIQAFMHKVSTPLTSRSSTAWCAMPGKRAAPSSFRRMCSARWRRHARGSPSSAKAAS